MGSMSVTSAPTRTSPITGLFLPPNKTGGECAFSIQYHSMEALLGVHLFSLKSERTLGSPLLKPESAA